MKYSVKIIIDYLNKLLTHVEPEDWKEFVDEHMKVVPEEIKETWLGDTTVLYDCFTSEMQDDSQVLVIVTSCDLSDWFGKNEAPIKLDNVLIKVINLSVVNLPKKENGND